MWSFLDITQVGMVLFKIISAICDPFMIIWPEKVFEGISVVFPRDPVSPTMIKFTQKCNKTLPGRGIFSFFSKYSLLIKNTKKQKINANNVKKS